MARKTPNGSWRAQVMLRGQRYTQNFRTKALAERQEAIWKGDLGADIPAREKAPVARKTALKDVYTLWRDSSAKVELADSTVLVTESRWRNHLEPSFGDRMVSEITEADCLALRAKLVKTCKASFANLVLELFRSLTKLALRQGLISVDPWAHVKRLPVDEQRFGYWTPEQREQFLSTCRKRDPELADLVTIAVHTGMRWGELYALERRHVDLAQRRVTVSANFRPSTRKTVETTKTRKIGVIPINESAMKVLREKAQLEPTHRIFRQAVLEDAKARLARIAKLAKVPEIRFHDLRHTFASCLCLTGVDIYTVQRLMRHSSIQTTQRYAHLCESHLALAAERLCGKTSYPDFTPLTKLREVRSAESVARSVGYSDGPLVKWNLATPLKLVR